MAQNTTTHRHDFRWPTTDCLVPRAEAPNLKCVPPPSDGSGRVRPWCGMDKPVASVAAVEAPSGDSAKPWTQRGLLVEMISPRPATTPPRVRTMPAGCEAAAPATNWCEGDAPSRPLTVRVGAARYKTHLDMTNPASTCASYVIDSLSQYL
ncbi:uncharacterized protein LOC128990749 isoform X2 [Macrosteles quadrilineatus]|nr:uncharacterized protein LOC128990749 isoform X2 [Macrosteles quadrilineatus]